MAMYDNHTFSDQCAPAAFFSPARSFGPRKKPSFSSARGSSTSFTVQLLMSANC